MRHLTPRDINDIKTFKLITGSDLVELNRYVSEEWDWQELWDYNFHQVSTTQIKCKCAFEGIRAALRRKGYPKSIRDLEALGYDFTLIHGGGSWYEDAFYQCSCGQKWKEEFVESMQYNGNHARPIDDAEYAQIIGSADSTKF
ncbi:MAG TPA: hypothetical protein VIZ65_14930 [Cellvibrionaceae bacterium]